MTKLNIAQQQEYKVVPVDETCQSEAFLPMTVSAPVQVKPFVRELPINAFCCGDPVLTRIPPPCRGKDGVICSFIITQNICVEIPIEIGVRSRVGDPFVQCGTPTSEDVCSDCDSIALPEDIVCRAVKHFLARPHHKQNHWTTPNIII